MEACIASSGLQLYGRGLACNLVICIILMFWACKSSPRGLPENLSTCDEDSRRVENSRSLPKKAQGLSSVVHSALAVGLTPPTASADAREKERNDADAY